MTYNIAISNRVNERLVALKGDGSYSAAIESLLNKCEPAHQSAKIDTQAATDQAVKQGEGNE